MDRDLTSYASLIEGVRGMRAALQLQPGGGCLGSHDIGFDITHRNLSRLLPSASLSMRRHAGHSIKSALSHLYTHDSRDDPFFATTGHFYKLYQELAGFGGDAQHYKVETETQFSRCFFNGWAFSLNGQAGLLRSLDTRAPLFCDRFQLGGPTSIRMFRFNSLGPKDAMDSLGGDMYYSFKASLFAPIPTRPDWPLKLHTFLNAGQLIQLDPKQSLTDSVNRKLMGSELLAKPSSSVGFGLMYRQGNLRAEVNFGVPLSMRVNDGAQKGIQLGIGVSFM
jgi:outer membrane protein insertion porin family